MSKSHFCGVHQIHVYKSHVCKHTLISNVLMYYSFDLAILLIAVLVCVSVL